MSLFTKKPQEFVFKVFVVVLTIIVLQATVIVWLVFFRHAMSKTSSVVLQLVNRNKNIVAKAFPDVDFKQIYPGMNAADIDLLQRQSFSIRYIYEPYVQFKPAPLESKFIMVSEAGYRQGKEKLPWPPKKDGLTIFVFGGSTTFGYGITDQDTLTSKLQEKLSHVYGNKNIYCYNFGSGYYFSTQERIFFEQLLLRGIVPDVALFVDGLNDYYYDHGIPEFTSRFDEFTAAGMPGRRLQTFRNNDEAVKAILDRYEHNVKMIEANAKIYNVSVGFVGQPVPYFYFPINDSTYPFHQPFKGHDLLKYGYPAFEKAGKAGRFGNRFMWLGDLYKEANAIMYVDSIHYSSAGTAMLADAIVKQSLKLHILPRT